MVVIYDKENKTLLQVAEFFFKTSLCNSSNWQLWVSRNCYFSFFSFRFFIIIIIKYLVYGIFRQNMAISSTENLSLQKCDKKESWCVDITRFPPPKLVFSNYRVSVILLLRSDSFRRWSAWECHQLLDFPSERKFYAIQIARC